MPDYLPRTDSEFDSWFGGFIHYSLAHGDALGLTRQQIAELQAVRRVWDEAYARHQLAREAAKEATVIKEMTRVAGEQALRKYVRVIQARPDTTNEQRRALGITVKPDLPQRVAARRPAAQPFAEPVLLGY